MVTITELQGLFQKSMEKHKVPMDVHLDKVNELGVGGGYRITLTVRPKGAPKVDPFKVGTVFQLGRRSYEVVGKNLRRWKFPVQVERLPDRRRFCVTIQSVQDGFLYVRGE